MNINNTAKFTYPVSILIHILFLMLLALLSIKQEIVPEEYLMVGFGSSTGSSASAQESSVEELTKADEKVELPQTANVDDNDAIKVAKTETKPAKTKPEKTEIKSENDEYGLSDLGSEFGQYGIDVDWGGKGIRKIQSWNIPPYPDGVAKEADVKLQFSILPDGTVGKIIPLRKADTRLEMAAINSLRKWRFEPIPSSKKQLEQVVMITFPFRLR